MKWVEDIKTTIGNRTLKNRMSDHARQMHACNLDDAKSIGIIYDATDSASFEIVRELTKKLAEKTENVSILGFVNSKKVNDQLLYRKGFDLISLNDLNWYNKPNSPVAEKFMKEPFDLLLDLSLMDHFPIRYIVSVSNAAFKAGRFSARDESLDFMIDIEREKENVNHSRLEIIGEAGIPVTENTSKEELAKITDVEVQLQFLISQLIHYLSIFNK